MGVFSFKNITIVLQQKLMFTKSIQRLFAGFLITSSLIWSVPAAALELDLAAMDRSVKPGDDFFRYANGGWIKTAQIPPDRSSFGAFNVVAGVVDHRMKDLIAEAGKGSSPESKMVADYYHAFMDEKGIEERGLDPIRQELASIHMINDNKQLSSFLGSQLRNDVDPLNATNFYTDRLFGVFISADFNNPTKNVPYLLQGGLGMAGQGKHLCSGKRGYPDPHSRRLAGDEWVLSTHCLLHRSCVCCIFGRSLCFLRRSPDERSRSAVVIAKGKLYKPIRVF